MANITLITVGTLKEEYLKSAVDEYKKRLSQYARVDEVNIKEERISNEDDRTEIARALAAEGEKILAAVPKGATKIALCVEGRHYSSEQLAEMVGKCCDETGKIALIIGSSHGLADAVKLSSDARISLSALTFPHQLARVILYEALYRSFTILAGKKYHK